MGAGPPAGIVVGVDGSEGSRAALRWALAEARRWGSPLRIVYASGPPAVGPRGPGLLTLAYVVGAIEGRAERTLAASLEGIVDPAAADDVPISAEVVRAPPQVALVEAGESAQLLVVGARGARPHLLGIGSVSGACCHDARCPVVVVPADQPSVQR
jgi:nucleotide-binding universal stress UspA family protein